MTAAYFYMKAVDKFHGVRSITLKVIENCKYSTRRLAPSSISDFESIFELGLLIGIRRQNFNEDW
jgi:hypothetical protein